MNPISRIVRFRARPDTAAALADALLTTADTLAETSGCKSWEVHQGTPGTDSLFVVETWLSREQRDSALASAADSGHPAPILELVAEPPEVIETKPLGAAREVSGSSGVTRYSILEAPDLSQDTELLDAYELEEVGEARYVRRELGAVQTGLTHYRLPADRRLGWAHRHSAAEETYVVIAGSARMKVDDELFALERLDAVRIAPRSVREFEAGPEGLEMLAFGTHIPGDGEMVADWWSD